MAVPCLDICMHPSIQILDIVHDNEEWRIINFYHDVRDNTCLQVLLDIDISTTTPTLIIGDFNTHSPAWSPPGIPQSHWTSRLKEWAATNLLMLANNPGEITRKGSEHEKDSVIDLAWYNEAAIQAATFLGLQLDWAGSLGSDHAMLQVTGHTQEHTYTTREEAKLGFLINPEKCEEWILTFKAKFSAASLPHSPSVEELKLAAAALSNDIHKTNLEVLRKCHPHHPKALPWWNMACIAAVQNLQNAHGQTKAIAHTKLKGTIHTAKRKWADKYIEKAQLWDVAAWCHGWQLTKVSVLRRADGGLVHSHMEMADIFTQCFFPQSPPQVATHFTDDPPPHQT
jgi:Endonuclease-reverse transcriptase